MQKLILLLLNTICWSLILPAQAPPLQLQIDQPGAAIQPTMWGIFFEDINLAADGGIYAELVKNRSFEFSEPLMGWKVENAESEFGNVLIINRSGLNSANPRFARVSVQNDNSKLELHNQGFRGMGIKQGETYHFSLWAKAGTGNLSLNLSLVSSTGKKLAQGSLPISGSTWKKHELSFKASDTEAKAKLVITFQGKGSVDLDMISLFPATTWKNRPGGLRADLAQLLADLKPGFLRFPGGCIVEGRDLSQRYQWKKSVGAIESREMIVNRWNTEFLHRPTPDYYQTFGLGFFEYFQLAEDIGAEPLPILNCGMACQFNTAEVVPMDELDPYVQDALDLIEFANGSTDSPWGKLRAEMGHPAPFKLKLLGVGNEQWGPQYFERYKVFAKAIKAKYPNIKLVSGTGPFPEGSFFDLANQELKDLNAEIVDEHYYRNPSWFLDNATRYDKYDRKGPKIFAGEYAAQSVAIASPDNKNNWECALSEAAFMTGLERNAEVVNLCSYAPLFAHSEGWQWTPNLIWFDNLRAMGTPNYYVQKLFSNFKGTHTLPLLHQGQPLTGQERLYGSAVLDKNSNEVILKLVNATDKNVSRDVELAGIKKLNTTATQWVLKGTQLDQLNSLDKPTNISPIESSMPLKGKMLKVELAAHSVTVLKFKLG